jgi:hypothetical protein
MCCREFFHLAGYVKNLINPAGGENERTESANSNLAECAIISWLRWNAVLFVLPFSLRLLIHRMVRNLSCLAVLVALAAVWPAQAEDAPATSSGTPATAAKSTGQKDAASSEVELQKWIRQLGSADYRIREEAVTKLSAAGRRAIEPLTKAALADDLETSYRSVRILQTLLDDGDQATMQQAVASLQKLAADSSKPAADLATDALAYYRLSQQDKAIETLQRLGATVSNDQPNLDPGELAVTLDSRWKGKNSDLNLLKQIRNLAWLRVINHPLDEKELATIGELSQAEEIDLFGTGISAQAAQELGAALPNALIDRRNGAFLGVGGSPGLTNCLITEVREDSAAAAAGILVGDEITSFDGKPVHDFEEFTKLVSDCKGGDQIELKIHRDNDTLTKKVTLGQWQSDQPVIFHGNPRVRNTPAPVQIPASPPPVAPPGTKHIIEKTPAPSSQPAP